MDMTPAETSLYYIMKVKQNESERHFLMDENRMQNFYTIKSAFGDTKSIKAPSDLYKFRFEEEEAKNEVNELAEKLASPDQLKELAKVMQKAEKRTVGKEELQKLIPIK